MKNFAEFVRNNKKAIYEFTEKNTPRNKNGDAVISKEDPWFYEDEWDEYYKELVEHDRNSTAGSLVRRISF